MSVISETDTKNSARPTARDTGQRVIRVSVMVTPTAVLPCQWVQGWGIAFKVGMAGERSIVLLVWPLM